MAKANAGCLGWILAGALLFGLVAKCAGGSSVPDGVGGDPSATRSTRTWQYVQPVSAHCRSEPGTSAESIVRLRRNSFVTVVATEGGWSRLDRSPGCWMRSDLLGDSMAPASTPVRELLTSAAGGTDRQAARRSSRLTRYANCAAARAAGADPVMRGDPGYSRRLDRDGDGVGCE